MSIATPVASAIPLKRCHLALRSRAEKLIGLVRYSSAIHVLMPSPQFRIARAFDLLTQGVSPFVEREMQACYRDNWQEAARGSFREDRGIAIHKGEKIRWDAHAMLTVMWDQWNGVFRQKLSHADRSLVSELREYRNRWAHQQQFGFDDMYRILDSVERLLKSVGATEVETVRLERRTLMHEEVSDEMNRSTKTLQNRRNFVETLAIYIGCGSVVAFQIWQLLGWDGWIVWSLVLVLFGLLTYKRLQPQPLSVGPHECPHCRRIIYSALCPYCQPDQANKAGQVNKAEEAAAT